MACYSEWEKPIVMCDGTEITTKEKQQQQKKIYHQMAFRHVTCIFKNECHRIPCAVRSHVVWQEKFINSPSSPSRQSKKLEISIDNNSNGQMQKVKWLFNAIVTFRLISSSQWILIQVPKSLFHICWINNFSVQLAKQNSHENSHVANRQNFCWKCIYKMLDNRIWNLINEKCIHMYHKTNELR